MTKKEYIERYGEDAYKKHLEKQNKYQKKYNEDNKESIREYQKQYYQDNKEHILEQQKQYHQDNKEHITEYQKQYHKTKNYVSKYKPNYFKQYYNTPMGRTVFMLNHCKSFDNTRFGENTCDLTHDWIINNILNATHCHYCGCELNYDNLSIDRKNSDLPHTKENCVACCKTCNNCKQDTPYDEYIAKLRETSNN